ncbi:MAG: hypothetical protein ABR875_03620 [Minisyncoccia bacterium]|jgi:hypothetical protein
MEDKVMEFIKAVSPKINPNAAFDLLRDSRINALIRLLTQKGILSQQEVETAEKAELEKVAGSIQKMPPLPSNQPPTQNKA